MKQFNCFISLFLLQGSHIQGSLRLKSDWTKLPTSLAVLKSLWEDKKVIKKLSPVSKWLYIPGVAVLCSLVLQQYNSVALFLQKNN